MIPASADEPLSIGPGAALIAEPWMPPDSVATQLRGFAGKNLIHSFGMRGSGRTAHRLYRMDQWAVAKVLSQLTDFGFADSTVLSAASNSMITASRERGDRSAIQQAIEGFEKGEPWVFELGLFRHQENGDRQVQGRLRNLNGKKQSGFGLPTVYRCHAVVTVELTPIFAQLFRKRESGKS